MVMTKRGIFHNLNESKYAISNSEVALFFSSKFYLNKFYNEYQDHRELFRNRIARAMNVSKLNVDMLADVHLYHEIEKRGFRVREVKNAWKGKGCEFTWQSLRLYALHKMTVKSTLDWYVIPVQKSEGQKGTTV